MKRATQTHGFAPGCTSGYVSSRKCGQRVSLFAAPRDPERFEAWRRAITRADKTLDERSVLCEHHFDEQYIERYFTQVINGELVKIPRDRPVLTKDAIPTIYPNVPAYLSKKTPQKRKSKTSSCGLPLKSPRREASVPSHGEALHDINDEGSGSSDAAVADLPALFDLQNCELPSSYWTKHRIVGADNVTAFTVCALDRRKLSFERWFCSRQMISAFARRCLCKRRR